MFRWFLSDSHQFRRFFRVLYPKLLPLFQEVRKFLRFERLQLIPFPASLRRGRRPRRPFGTAPYLAGRRGRRPLRLLVILSCYFLSDAVE